MVDLAWCLLVPLGCGCFLHPSELHHWILLWPGGSYLHFIPLVSTIWIAVGQSSFRLLCFKRGQCERQIGRLHQKRPLSTQVALRFRNSLFVLLSWKFQSDLRQVDLVNLRLWAILWTTLVLPVNWKSEPYQQSQ